MRDTKQMLRNKVAHLKEIYNFDFDHFFHKTHGFCFCLFYFILIRTNSATYETNVKKQNYSFQKDLQILFRPFFDKTPGFCFNREKCY